MQPIRILPIIAGIERPSLTVNFIGDAFGEFSSFAQDHAVELLQLQKEWSDEEKGTRVGFSVEFELPIPNSKVVIHAIDEGGIAICQLDGRLRLTHGALSSEELVAFLHPDWTEFELCELNTYDFLRQAMKEWAESGIIPSMYLR